jgi:hypothetical protein
MSSTCSSPGGACTAGQAGVTTVVVGVGVGVGVDGLTGDRPLMVAEV